MDDDIPEDEVLQRDEDTPVDEIDWTCEGDKAGRTPNLSTDDSDLEDPVLLSKGEYHEIKNDGRPACDAGGKLERVEREEAYEVAYPCQEVWCKRYRKNPHRF